MSQPLIHNEIIVVSGLPRSGTSLMMQMLQAGGLPLHYDEKRPADMHNPKGYFELEAVKNLQENSSWLNDATGKAIKIISYHLPDLPPQFHYKVIFMQRDLREVVLSQNKMLLQSGKPLGRLNEWELIEKFEVHIQQIMSWLKQQTNLELLPVPYSGLVNMPEHWAKLIVKFLNKKLNIREMALQIDSSLYRVKLT